MPDYGQQGGYDMSTTYGERRRATANIGDALRARGWALEGYKPDKSESMTDYYDPAHWDGIARKGICLALVDLSEYNVKKWGNPRPVYGDADGPCSACGGTGKTRHDVPRMVMRDLLTMTAVQVTPARPAGSPCPHCEGTGRRIESRVVGEDPAIPHLRQCAGRWYVVRADTGRVISTGVRPIAAGAFNDTTSTPAINRCAAEIDRAAMRPACIELETAAMVTTDGATVRPSAVSGNVEVVHGAKPPVDVREELKRAGFRWSGPSACWYGPAAQLPGRYAATV